MAHEEPELTHHEASVGGHKKDKGHDQKNTKQTPEEHGSRRGKLKPLGICIFLVIASYSGKNCAGRIMKSTNARIERILTNKANKIENLLHKEGDKITICDREVDDFLRELPNVNSSLWYQPGYKISNTGDGVFTVSESEDYTYPYDIQTKKIGIIKIRGDEITVIIEHYDDVTDKTYNYKKSYPLIEK